jgi:hypothetical protein
MGYVYVVLIWFVASAAWAAMGAALGPGVMMLIVGSIVASCGCLYSLSEKIFHYQLRLTCSGLIVFAASSVVTLLVLPSLTLTITGSIFLALFILIPGYLILFILRKSPIKF